MQNNLKGELELPRKKVAQNTVAQNTNQQTEIVKQHRNRPDLAKFGEEHTQPGDNARFLRFALASKDLPPIDISDPKQVENRIYEYFNFCVDNDRKPNMVGMANWLGVSHETLASWKRGDYRTGTHSAVVRKAIGMLEELWVDYMQNGKMNPASGIFLAKNMFQYRDVIDIAPAAPAPLGESVDADTLKTYAAELPDDTTDE